MTGRIPKMNIVVLTGGISTERDVSLSSGTQIYRALKKRGHNAILLDVYLGYEKEGIDQIFSLDKEWAEDTNAVGVNNPDIEAIKALRRDPENGFFGPNVIDICRKADIVFLGLHGENGENGKIQATFDLLGIQYTGTDFVSSALSMDKALSKELFAYHGIPTPAGIHLKKGETDPKTVPFPCVVKTTCGGSSVGVYIVYNQDEYEEAKKNAFLYEDEIIVEAYIKGREFSIGVIEGIALPIIEIAPLVGFYDYKNKYQAGSTVETCPADLDQELTLGMQAIAEKVFKVLRLKTYARMDFLMDSNHKMYCLEANTLPGMTPTSLLPQEAEAMGMDFGQLCERLIQVSLNK